MVRVRKDEPVMLEEDLPDVVQVRKCRTDPGGALDAMQVKKDG